MENISVAMLCMLILGISLRAYRGESDLVSCDASNHEGAPMVTVCPLSSKLKDIQTVSKMAIRGKTGYIPVEAEVMEQIDRALIRQLNLIRAARNMVMEELSDGSEN